MGFPGRNAYPLVPAKGLERPFHIVDLADIDLDNFGSVTFPGIGNRNRQTNGFVRLQDRFAEGSLSYFKVGIAEPKPERKQVVGGIPICAAFHGIIFKITQVVRVFIESYGQFPRWIVISKQYIGNGQTARFTGVPGLENGIAGLCFGGQGNGRAGTIHKHHLFPRSFQSLQAIALNRRQFNIQPVPSPESRVRDRHFLALQISGQTSHKNNRLYAFQFLNKRRIIHIYLFAKIKFYIRLPIVELCVTDLNRVFFTGFERQRDA